MDRISTLVAILVASLYLVYKLEDTSRKRADWRVFALWLFAFCFAIGLVFRLESVYQFADSITHIDNFSWLMSRIFLTLSVYLATSSSVRIFQDREFYWIRLVLVAVLVFFFLVFFYGLANGLSYYQADDLAPLHPLALVARLIMLSYAAILILLPIRVFSRLLKTEDASSARLRWGILLVASLAAFTLFSAKAILSALVQMGLSTMSILQPLLLVGAISQGVVLSWPLAFLPERFHSRAIQPFVFIKKAIYLHNLNYLCRCFSQVGLSIQATPIDHPWTHLRHLDRSLYQALIRILDCESILLASSPSTNWPSEVAYLHQQLAQLQHQRGTGFENLSVTNTWEPFRELWQDHPIGLDDFTRGGYDEQLKIYSQLSRQLRSQGFAKSRYEWRPHSMKVPEFVGLMNKHVAAFRGTAAMAIAGSDRVKRDPQSLYRTVSLDCASIVESTAQTVVCDWL